MSKKCLDTYALIEIAQGNPNFALYLNQDFIITELTLAEFYAVLLRNEDEQKADYWFKKLEHYTLPVNKSVLIEAMRFRHDHRKQRISFFDAVGYIFSLRNQLQFVTGDKEFEHFKSVEFRKH